VVFIYVYSRYALCLLLQILFVAALDIKTRDVPTVNSITRCKNIAKLHIFCKFLCIGGEGAPTVRFALVVPWAKAGPGYMFTVTVSTMFIHVIYFEAIVVTQ
jgi:hypothetical protein